MGFKKGTIDKACPQTPHSDAVALPNMVLMGFQSGSSKKDLMLYLRSKVQDSMDPATAKYQLLKEAGGYYWELHDCGSGHGVLSSVIELLREQDEVVFATSECLIKVTGRANTDGICTFVLNEDDAASVTGGVTYKDPMRSMSNQGTAVMYFGLWYAGLGLVSLMLALTFKYVLLNQFDPRAAKTDAPPVPYTMHSKIKSVLAQPGAYLESLSWDKAARKYVTSIKIEPPIMPEQAPGSQPALKGRAADLKSSTTGTKVIDLPDEALLELYGPDPTDTQPSGASEG